MIYIQKAEVFCELLLYLGSTSLYFWSSTLLIFRTYHMLFRCPGELAQAKSRLCGSNTGLGEYVIVIILANQSLALRSAELQSSEEVTLKTQQNVVRYFPLVLWCSLQLILTSSKMRKRWSLELAGSKPQTSNECH